MADPHKALDAIGLLPDSEIEPALAALQLARLDDPGDAWLEASAHLSELAHEAASLGVVLTGRPAEVRAGALAGLIHARFGYRGDRETYDDLENASLIRVIARRRGLPVALGILWLHCIRAAGWSGHGIDFPGHFLLAIAADVPNAASSSSRQATGGLRHYVAVGALVDAFDNGAVLNTPELVALQRRLSGEMAPLRPGMLRPMSIRDVLLRLQRNLVQRRANAGDFAAALVSLGGMLQIAPDFAPNWLEAADLHRRVGQPAEAVSCRERFLALVPQSDTADEIRARIAALRRQA